jgi:hypothetical protein
MEKKIKHLEMIQGVISRMASNSFMLKGWAVTLIAGIYALSGKDNDKMYFLVAYIPIILFWVLDTYYLFQERLYRAMYSKVQRTEESKIDFSMVASAAEFGDDKKNNYVSCLFSLTELGFYLPLAVVCAGIIIITGLK